MRLRIWCLLFVASGFAAILYEVVFNKYVSYVFGSTAYATSTVLAAYMGGLSVGSAVGGWAADRVRRPLLLYGALELAAALYFLVAGPLLDLAGHAQRALWAGRSVALLTAFQFGASFLVVAVPTVFLGATFPLVAKGLLDSAPYERIVSRLYASNTLGTAAGALGASYVLVPALGLRGTLGVAVRIAVAILAAVLVLELAPGRRPAGAAQAADAPEPPPPAAPGALGRRALLALAFASGFSVFGYEVVWTHLFALLLGNSVYSFAVVLFSVLLGMSIGSALVGRAGADLRRLVVSSQLAFLGSGLLLALLVDRIPGVFDACAGASTSFAAREVVKFAVTAGTLVVPCAALGVFFPALVTLAAPERRRAGRAIGAAYALNTVGAVLGSVATGFVVLPLLGSRGSLLVLACGNAAVVVFLALRWPAAALRRRRLLAAGAAAVLATALAHPRWDWQRLLQATGVYFTPMPTSAFDRILDHREDVHGGVTTVVQMPDGVHVLLSNGKFQGDDGPEIVDQYAFALLTEVYPHGHRSALNVGVGVGGTLGVLSQLPFERVDAVEIARPILDAARDRFGAVNFGSLSRPRGDVHVLDGRHFLALAPDAQRYDAVTVQVSSIWFAGAANLYSADFYALVAARLQPHGVLQQWVQLHHTTREHFLVVLKTIRSVFRHVALFVPGHQGILIASNEPLRLDAGHLASLRMPPALAARGLDFEDLAGSLLLDPEDVDALLAAEAGPLPISTNDRPWLEFETPKGNVLGFNFSEVVSWLLERRDHAPGARLVRGDASRAELDRIRFKLKVRELKLYRPYTPAWLRVLNELSTLDLDPSLHAAFASLLAEARP